PVSPVTIRAGWSARAGSWAIASNQSKPKLKCSNSGHVNFSATSVGSNAMRRSRAARYCSVTFIEHPSLKQVRSEDNSNQRRRKGYGVSREYTKEVKIYFHLCRLNTLTHIAELYRFHYC